MFECLQCYGYVIFFFKQKTAYEMRISDWSSDVCSSDLVHAARRVEQRLHRALRHDVGARLLLFGEVEAARRAPAVDAAPPFAKVARLVALCLPAGDDRIERAAGVADHREVDGHDLVDRAAVDVDVDLL